MTKKEMFSFIDEKYAEIEKLERAPHERVIADYHKNVQEQRDECIKDAAEQLSKDLLRTGCYSAVGLKAVSISVYNYELEIKYPDFVVCAQKQIQEIAKRCKVEKQELKDDLLLCGIKDPVALLKLEALRDRVRKLTQEIEEEK